MSRLAYPTQLRDHLGNEVRLPTKPFAVGGEGAVFDVVGRPDSVAKLYSKPQSKERCDKLRAMAKLCSPDLLKIAAWPTATLSNGNPAVVDGILMPRIVDHLEIHHLYSVAQRKKDFPQADWGFLLHTARNCAIAFETVHQHGHLVGDVNQKNVMVSKKGIVALVDCDSFQVAEGNRIYRCGVGVPEYTPPELHGKNFANLDRTADHDRFGLAVLVFHLLMMGRHPFSGVPLVSADIPIEKAIQDGLYAYARNPTKLKPPPHVPPVTMLDAATLDLFERAFGSTSRPTATEWRNVLDGAMNQLQRCKNDAKHSYLRASGQCPWCQLIAVSRLMFFLPGQGAAMPFRPEDIDQLIRKLGGMPITFAAYVRPSPVLPIQVSLPPGLRSIQKPALLPHPAPPAPVQKPTLTPSPPAPVMLPMPQLKPMPPAPSLVQRPPLKLHPAPPAPAQKPILTPLPVDRPSPKPPLKPHPPAPAEPPRPILHPVPLPPVYPPMPTPGPPDPFLARVCVAGLLSGLPLLLIAPPVGVIAMIGFGAWWLIMMVTEDKRRAITSKSLKAAYELQCALMDEDYAELCQPIEEANKKLTDLWQAEWSAISAKYRLLCLRIDDENYREFAAWEEAEAARRSKRQEQCREIHTANEQLIIKWEAVNSVPRAEHARVCAAIDAENHRLIAAWELRNDEIMAEYDRERDEVEQANRRVLAAWEAANASRQAAYDRARREIEQENQRLTSAWEAFNATRQAEHQRVCREIDANNGRVIAEWEAANIPWVAEEKRWRERVSNAKDEILRLESNLNRQRKLTESTFRQRKDEATGIAAGHDRAKLDYVRELRQAEDDSTKIQLDEHLDKALIRQAKLKGITGDRVLSLESFGIETAKDVPLLSNQKVPGIGPVLSKRLFDWRNSLMASFQPQKTLPDSEKNRIASRYAPIMLPLGQSILEAMKDLDRIALSHRNSESEMIKAIASAVQNLAIAEAYVKAMKLD